MTFSQSTYNIRREWGLHGAELLTHTCDAIIIVDVLSFSTAVTIAVSNGGIVFPYRLKDESRVAFAEQHSAILAGPRKTGGYSLSPASLSAVQSGERIVLPSPNGATISLATDNTLTYAGCLRNAKVVAEAAMQHGKNIGVIPCGERWQGDGSLRPAAEDLIGAGAIIHYLSGEKSIEAQLAEQFFLTAQPILLNTIRACSSGRELRDMGFEQDIMVACELNRSVCAPYLIDGAYRPL